MVGIGEIQKFFFSVWSHRQGFELKEVKEIEFSQGDFLLRESWEDKGDFFLGKVTVLFKGKPVWSMTCKNYYRLPYWPFFTEVSFGFCKEGKLEGDRQPVAHLDPGQEVVHENNLFQEGFGRFHGRDMVRTTGKGSTIIGHCEYWGFLLDKRK